MEDDEQQAHHSPQQQHHQKTKAATSVCLKSFYNKHLRIYTLLYVNTKSFFERGNGKGNRWV